jgi:putative colanic acid biosynthesis acetyltransferase WcaF
MAEAQLDVNANRNARKYSRKLQLMRFLWGCVLPFFRFSPRICFGWRTFLLRLFGAKIGKQTHIYNSAIIYMPWNLTIGNQSSIGEWALVYNLGPIIIGNQTTISQRTHLCAGTHDFTDPSLPLLKPAIFIKDQVWVCADAFVGPGVVVNEGAIVGARAVVMKEVSAWVVVAGNPAQIIRKRDVYDTAREG